LIFGYARVSTEEQKTDRQIDALRQFGVDEIFEEKASGKDRGRPQLNMLLSKLRAGDTLVVYELKRLGRSSKQLLAMAEEFVENGIELVSLTENIDTSQPVGKFLFTVFCALAQLDRDLISENTKHGLKAARERGRVGGRKPLDDKKVTTALKMYHSNMFKVKEIIEATGISKAALYAYIAKYKERDGTNGSQ